MVLCDNLLIIPFLIAWILFTAYIAYLSYEVVKMGAAILYYPLFYLLKWLFDSSAE